MPIGEFGKAPSLAPGGGPALTTPMYWMYEMAQASLNPARAVTDATKILFQNPLNPWSHAGGNQERVGKAVLPPASLRPHADAAAAHSAAARADRGADVRPLRHAAAWHGGSLPALA